MHLLHRLRHVALVPLLFLLGGCNFVVLSPSGDVAGQQRDLLLMSTGLMLLVIIPVMALTVLFAWRYRQSNREADYDPEWNHSTQLELLIWSVPLLIIICLGALTWMGTHLLDPYRPLGRIAANRPVAAEAKPLQVDVVALDWKWLFFYPEYGIASVNEMAAPVDRPIDFRITSSSVMNSFYVPALAGQIYAMPGMQTRLHAVINQPGTYEGFSANYSGAGFSNMRFAFRGVPDGDFDAWVAKAKASGQSLDRQAYLALERPSEKEPVRYYASVEGGLFDAILNMCVETGKMCMKDMAAIDAKGGLGLAGAGNVLPRSLEYDKYARRGAVFSPEPAFVASLCTPEDPTGRSAARTPAAVPRDPTPLTGFGLQRPYVPIVDPSTAMPVTPRAASNS